MRCWQPRPWRRGAALAIPSSSSALRGQQQPGPGGATEAGCSRATKTPRAAASAPPCAGSAGTRRGQEGSTRPPTPPHSAGGFGGIFLLGPRGQGAAQPLPTSPAVPGKGQEKRGRRMPAWEQRGEAGYLRDGYAVGSSHQPGAGSLWSHVNVAEPRGAVGRGQGGRAGARGRVAVLEEQQRGQPHLEEPHRLVVRLVELHGKPGALQGPHHAGLGLRSAPSPSPAAPQGSPNRTER